MSEIQFSGLPGDKVQNPAPAIDPKTGTPFADHKPDDSPTHLAEFKMEGIDDLINNFNGQYNKAHEKVEKLEEDFKDTKLTDEELLEFCSISNTNKKDIDKCINDYKS